MYKIIDFDVNTAQVIVLYKDMSPICVDLPIDENGRVPTGSALHDLIKNFIPVWHFERLEKVKKGLHKEDIDYISSLVEKLPEPVIEEQDLKNQLRFKRNSFLYDTDWTQLPDVGLKKDEKEAFAAYRQKLRDLTKQEGFPFNINWPEPPK